MSNEQNEDTDLVKNLRETINRLQSERDEYKAQVRDAVIGDTFQQYGLDPNKGAGRLAAQAYEGDLAPDAVQSWLDEQGFEPRESSQQQTEPEGMGQRLEQRQKLGRIEGDSLPAGSGGPKMTVAEHQQLLKSDPQAALKAAREGRIEFSTPAAAAALNDTSRRTVLG